MTRQEIDTLWYKAMHDSIKAGEDFIRYHFFKLAVAVEREACAQLVEHFDSTNPTLLAEAIRKRSEI